jgi:hypothetical protein
MNKFAAGLSALAFLLSAAPGHAQATRTWVSQSQGSDANPCSRTAPCQTFAGAIVKTTINGEINCIDSGAFGTVTITKSITIDCHDNFAGILASSVNGIVVNIPTSANDPLRTVRLRNININGTGTSGTIGTRTGLNGIRIDGALAVFVEDVTVSGFTQRGLIDQRTSAGKLFVKNSTFRDNGTSGLVVSPSTGSATIDVVIEGSQFIGNVVAGIAVNNGPRATVKRSIMSGNGIGIDSEATAGVTQLVVDDSQVSSNATGWFQSGGGSIRISNSEVAFNTAAGSGTINSFTNSRFSGNGAGGGIAVIGGPTSPTGQQ